MQGRRFDRRELVAGKDSGDGSTTIGLLSISSI